MSVVTRAFLRYLTRRRGLSTLQVLGVACGVGAVVGMVLSAQSAMESFSKTVTFLRGSSTHVLQRPAGPMSEEILKEVLLGDPAVKAFCPVIDRRISLDSGEVVRILGLDPFLDRKVRPELFPQKEASADGDSQVMAFFLDEKAVLVDSLFALQRGLSKGQTLRTSHGDLKVLGEFRSPYGEPLIIMDISHAQSLFSMPGKIDRVDLILGHEESFSSRLPSGYLLRSAREQETSFTGMLSAFRLNLEALSLLALFVGMFLVYNTAMFAVISRRREAGILISLGATRVEILRAFGAELSILGLLGGGLGGCLGYLLSLTLSRVVGQTISQLYFHLMPQPPQWSWLLPLMGAFLGLGASGLGGALPLRELIKTDPVRVLYNRAPQRENSSDTQRWILGGILVLTASCLVLLLFREVYAGFASAFGVLLGASLLVGPCIKLLRPLLGRLGAALAGINGRLAAGNVSQNLSRTAVAVAAFMVALSLSIGLGSMIGSFRQTLLWWMEGQLRGDLYIAPSLEIEIPQALYRNLQELKGIAGIDPYRNTKILYQGHWVHLSAVDADTLKKFAKFEWLKGGDEHWEKVKQGDVIISESFSRRFKVKEGDSIFLQGASGLAQVRVEAVFYDYTTEHGLIMMDRKTYLQIFQDSTIDALVVFLEPGRPHPRDTLEQAKKLAWDYGIPVAERREFHESILDVFDATFAVTRTMRILAVIVAFFGIAGATLAMFMEREKDFGVYRALGFSTSQVAVMTLVEGVMMGMLSFLVSLPTGTAMSLVLVYAINLRSFHWTIFFSLQPDPYLAALLTSLTASAGAALYPVLRACSTYPLMQIREE